MNEDRIDEILKEIEDKVSKKPQEVKISIDPEGTAWKEVTKSVDNMSAELGNEIGSLSTTITKKIDDFIKKETVDLSPAIKDMGKAVGDKLERLNGTMTDFGKVMVNQTKKEDDKSITKGLTDIVKKLDEIKPEPLPTDPKNPIAVRLSDGEEFYKAVNEIGHLGRLVAGGGGSTPKVFATGTRIEAVPVVNPDGSNILGGGGGGGDATAANQVTGNASLSSIDGKITAVDTGAVVVSSSALPSGAATSAKQDTGNTSVASIDTKTPALGQALAASSVPVVLTASQLTTLTPPAAITGFATETTVAAINTNAGAIADAASATGSISAKLRFIAATGIPVTGNVTVVQATAANLNMTEASASGILTSVQLIDDSVFTDDTSTHSTGSTKGVGIMAVADPTDAAVNANDIGMPAMNTSRFLKVIAQANSGVDIGDVDVTSVSGNVTVIQGTATNLKTQAEAYQGGSAVAAGNPLQVSLANHGANATAVKVNVASGGIASGAIASGAVASGAVASGAFASGALAAGSIAVGAITAGDTSIATTEDTASAAGEHLVKVGLSRLDTPVANAGVSNDGDYTGFIADNYRKAWVTGTVPEDTAHVAGEALTVTGSRRIDTLATSAGSSADWATVNQTAEGAAWATLAPTTTSGLSTFMASGSDGSSILVATAQVVKASAGNLYGYYLYNPESAATFVHFYNTAAASVTVGTTNPLFTVVVPATSAANLAFPYPVAFTNAGWSISATTTAGGNTGPSTGVSAVVWYL